MVRACLITVLLVLMTPIGPAVAQEQSEQQDTSVGESGLRIGNDRRDQRDIELGSGELIVGEVALVPLIGAVVEGWGDGVGVAPGQSATAEPADDAEPTTQERDGPAEPAATPGPCELGADEAVESLSWQEAEADEAERRMREQELLDASGYGRTGTNRGDNKLIKAATAQPDTDAIDDLWDQIQESESETDQYGATTDDDPNCVEHACYSERIEDVRFGHLSGEPDQGFAEYVHRVGGFIEFANRVGSPSAPLVDRERLATSLTTTRLGPRPGAESMPMFYYCRRGPAIDDPIELNLDGYWPVFGWTTTVAEQFDIAQARRETQEVLRTQLWGNAPVIETVPPVATGHTYVNLPMWLWLVDPLEHAMVQAVSDLQTARLQTRARLIDVIWDVGGTIIVCTPEQMREFNHHVDSITDRSVECQHMFAELVDYTITATARYQIEERITFRGHPDYPWPDDGWVPHPDPSARTVTVAGTTPTMSVHQILSLNIPLGLTDQEIAALTDQP